MAWYRAGGGGIPSSLKSDMNAVLNKKMGTSLVYPPDEWADTVNLMGKLPEKTVSGAIVTFSDGADEVPLKKCEVSLSASLDGYSEVDVVACGKNLVPLTGSAVTGDLTITPQSDGTVLVNGSKTTQTVYTTGSFVAPDDISFRYSGCTGGSASTYSVNIRIGNVYGADVFNGFSSTYTATKGTTVSFLIVVRANATVDNVVFSPMIRFSSEPDDTFEPYNGDTHTATLGRTIYGGTVDVVKGEGVDENDNPFTFDPVPIDSKLGNNTLWAEQGDTEVTYRRDIDLALGE